jgi:hypothetical protein
MIISYICKSRFPLANPYIFLYLVWKTYLNCVMAIDPILQIKLRTLLMTNLELQDIKLSTFSTNENLTHVYMLTIYMISQSSLRLH